MSQVDEEEELVEKYGLRQSVKLELQLPTEEALLADASPDPRTRGLVSRPAGCLAGWSRGWVWLVRWMGWLVACSCRCSWW